MKNLILTPDKINSWRNVAWGAYVTHIKKPNFSRYVSHLIMFPIAGHTSTDSRAKHTSGYIDPCDCHICQGPKYKT